MDLFEPDVPPDPRASLIRSYTGLLDDSILDQCRSVLRNQRCSRQCSSCYMRTLPYPATLGGCTAIHGGKETTGPEIQSFTRLFMSIHFPNRKESL